MIFWGRQLPRPWDGHGCPPGWWGWMRLVTRKSTTQQTIPHQQLSTCSMESPSLIALSRVQQHESEPNNQENGKGKICLVCMTFLRWNWHFGSEQRRPAWLTWSLAPQWERPRLTLSRHHSLHGCRPLEAPWACGLDLVYVNWPRSIHHQILIICHTDHSNNARIVYMVNYMAFIITFSYRQYIFWLGKWRNWLEELAKISEAELLWSNVLWFIVGSIEL